MSNLEIREGEYGDKVLALEPGGIEAIADSERHGKARNLFATWMSPNLEFATMFVGVLAVAVFGLSFAQSILAIVIGNALGATAQFILTQDGPRYGVPQMVVSRSAFGKLGNILPSIANAGAAGIGWFAVNSVSGAWALSSLTKNHLHVIPSLLIVVLVQVSIAFIGHNLVLVVERYLFPYLIVVFGVACIYVLSSSHLHLGAAGAGKTPGGFLITVASVYGYAAGWNPFAADYARYLPKTVDRKSAGLFAGLGLFFSAAVLEIVGAAAATAGNGTGFDSSSNPTGGIVSFMPGWIGKLFLLGIVGGSICANVLNIYSGSMSFLTIGVKLGSNIRRGLFATIFGIAGFFLAKSAMGNPNNNYTNFLLTMSYWIGPWLGVVLADKFLRKGASVEKLLYSKRENWAGPVSFVVAISFAIWGFVNQTWNTGNPKNPTDYINGYFVQHHPKIGDLTFWVGFIVAFVLYLILAGKKVKAESSN